MKIKVTAIVDITKDQIEALVEESVTVQESEVMSEGTQKELIGVLNKPYIREVLSQQLFPRTDPTAIIKSIVPLRRMRR